MMTGPNGRPEFKVVVSQSLKQLADELHDMAVQRGFGEQFIDALRTIEEGLRRAPTEFGDPLFRLPSLRLTICLRAVFPIAVDYGVHDQFPIVIVRGFRLMLRD